MGAIWMLSANDLRRRRVSTLAIALLIGIVGAVVIAAVAGARRSDTALRRFNDESHSANVEVEVGTPTAQQLRAFEGRAWHVRAVAFAPDGRSVVSCGDHTGRLWDVADGRPPQIP